MLLVDYRVLENLHSFFRSTRYFSCFFLSQNVHTMSSHSHSTHVDHKVHAQGEAVATMHAPLCCTYDMHMQDTTLANNVADTDLGFGTHKFFDMLEFSYLETRTMTLEQNLSTLN